MKSFCILQKKGIHNKNFNIFYCKNKKSLYIKNKAIKMSNIIKATYL